MLFCPTPIRAATSHVHDANCYNGTQHICAGSPTEYGLCYTEKVVEYHTHTGDPTLGEPNGCYTKENITYHVHNDTCYQNVEKNCTHTTNMGSTESLSTQAYYLCPKCGEFKFNGYKTAFPCNNSGKVENVYIGLCENCGYQGNATVSTQDGTNVLTYTHKVTTNDLVCGKTETTIESKTYELGCGKTSETIENTTYIKTCGKTNGAYYNLKGQKIEPTCDDTVISIVPAKQFQTTNSPDFTIVATYLDGHTEEIQPTTAAYNSSYKDYDKSPIELTYSGFITKAGNRGTIATYLYLTTPKESVSPTPTPAMLISTPTPITTQLPEPTATPIPTLIPTYENTKPIEINETQKEPTKELIGDNEINGNNISENNDVILGPNSSNLKSNSENEDTINLIQNKEEKPQQNGVSYATISLVLVIFIFLMVILLIVTMIYFMKSEKNAEDLEDFEENEEQDVDFDNIDL